jgi:RNA methyltransferase, TrmH family
MIIQSLINPKVKHLVALQRKVYRQEHNQFLAQGVNAYKTLLQAGIQLHSVFVTAQAHDEHHQILKPDTMFVVTDAIMEKISTQETPTGIVAIFVTPESKDVVSSHAIVLHNIQDPGNMGTLIRTAAAMGISTVVTIQGVDPYHPKVIQASAGTIGYVNIVQTQWPIFYKTYQHIPMCALVVDGGQEPEVINLKDCMLVIGNEAQGLPHEITKSCNLKMTIKMSGKIESLNAAVAGCIAMYLKSKQ